MKLQKISFEDSLEEKVVLLGKCVGCAACVVTCPISCLEYIEGKPKIVKECTSCGICSAVCPRYDHSQPVLERLVFGRERRPEEEFGIYQRMVVAQSTNKKILQACQDGGVVTTLLTFALERGIIDGAALSGVEKNEPFLPVPMLANSPGEVLSSAGTRYFYSSNLLALSEGLKQKKKSLAFVGTPCQILALRKIEAVPLKRYVNPLQATVGLMCTECFTYEGLMKKHILGELKAKISEIEKMNIKAKILVTKKSGEILVVPLKDAKKFTRPSCISCPDFSAELADISVGGLGLNGWTFTILRTEKGRRLFESAEIEGLLKTKPVEDERRALDLLIMLSQRKRRQEKVS